MIKNIECQNCRKLLGKQGLVKEDIENISIVEEKDDVGNIMIVHNKEDTEFFAFQPNKINSMFQSLTDDTTLNTLQCPDCGCLLQIKS